ncbi:MAG: hypothetical protein ABI611_17250 [Solirubrobacteraceae bacterium]
MPPPRSIAGQASAEYVALLAVVVAIVAGAAAVGSPPPLALKVAGAVRHGICLVTGGVCTPGEARAAGLPPCLVQARMDRERLGGRLLVVRLGRGDALLVERRSDGSAAVSFTDGGSAGGTVGVGLQIPGLTHAGVRGGAGLQFNSGRTWEFPSFAAAAAFVRRWTPRESLGGEAKRLLAHACPLCHHHRSPQMPPADATFREGGAYGEFVAALRGSLRHGGVGGEEEGEAGLILGRRVARGGRVTWYDRVDAEAALHLGAVLGAVEQREAGAASLEVTSVHDRPVELRLKVAARWHGDLDLPGPAGSVRDVASALRGAPAATPGGRGRRVEAEVSLDLTDPANLRALTGVLDVWRLRVRPSDWAARVRALAARLDRDGAVDVRLMRVALDERDLGAEAALGLAVGGSYRRTQEVRELLRAWSLRAGGAPQEREDCVSA